MKVSNNDQLNIGNQLTFPLMNEVSRLKVKQRVQKVIDCSVTTI